MKRKFTAKRILSAVLAVCLLLGAMSITALAGAIELPDVPLGGSGSGGVELPDDPVGGGSDLVGDVNGDKAVNILDVMAVINIITGSYIPTQTERDAADADGSKGVNILDAMYLINQITGTGSNATKEGPVTYDIQTVDRSWKNSRGNVLIHNSYDLIVLDSSAYYADAINAGIETDMEKFFSRDVREEYSSAAEVEELLEMTHYSYGDWFYDAAATVTHNGNGIFSARITTSWFMGGMFNANHYGVTFDLTTGNKATLPKLMNMSEAAAKAELETLVIDYVYDTYGNALLNTPAGVLKNYDLADYDFYVEDGQIILCFPTYTFVSGAAGPTVIPTGISVS